MQVFLLSLVGALSLTTIASAQHVPDEGVPGQQLQLERNLKLPSQTHALSPAPDIQLRVSTGAAIARVRLFAF